MERHIPLKTSVDVARIRQSCRIAERAIHFIGERIRPGVTPKELDRSVGRYLASQKANAALKGYRGFPGAVCVSVNNVAAHGVPGEGPMEAGDILTVDITVEKDGWHGDTAWTFVVGEADPDALRLVRASWQATLAGVMAVRSGAAIGDIGAAIARTAERHGCRVVQDYVGHGIGEALHEDPRIPHVGQKGTGLRIVPGMVFTVEPILTLGDGKVEVLEDGWTIITRDGSLSAQFEHTIAVFRDRQEILTLTAFDPRDHIDEPPML